jgi:Protein of unknown function (DUF3047)
LLALAFTAALTLGAGPSPGIRVDDWDSHSPGPLDLSAAWQRYPAKPTPFTHPPSIVRDAGRPVLQLVTSGEAMRIGRPLKIDVKKTPWLVWEWKPLVLPEGGDVRDPKRNDQAGRVALIFEGMKGLLYIWDTTAPVGAEVPPDALEMFQRGLIVVRSGPQGVGRWSREKRDVYRDYLRVFEEEPRQLKWVGLESHSNDTNTRTSILFGHVRFDAR